MNRIRIGATVVALFAILVGGAALEQGPEAPVVPGEFELRGAFAVLCDGLDSAQEDWAWGVAYAAPESEMFRPTPNGGVEVRCN